MLKDLMPKMRSVRVKAGLEMKFMVNENTKVILYIYRRFLAQNSEGILSSSKTFKRCKKFKRRSDISE